MTPKGLQCADTCLFHRSRFSRRAAVTLLILVRLFYRVTRRNLLRQSCRLVHKHNVHAFYLGAGIGDFPGTDVWSAWQANSTASGLNLNNPALRGMSCRCCHNWDTKADITDSATQIPLLPSVRQLARAGSLCGGNRSTRCPPSSIAISSPT